MDDTPEAAEDRSEVPVLFNGLKASSQKLRVLFNALSPLSGARRGAPKHFDPVPVIEQTKYLFKSRLESLRVSFRIDCEHPNRNVVGYSADLATAITNLIDNSLFWLDHHKISQPFIEVAITYAHNRCVIRVSDNGRGIPEEFADHVFNVGFSLKPHGTGLGLSIAKEAMSRSSGDLHLVSGEEGAVFELSMNCDQ